MTISERTLRKWRKEALNDKRGIERYKNRIADIAHLTPEARIMINERILQLTQELLDQHLIKKG